MVIPAASLIEITTNVVPVPPTAVLSCRESCVASAVGFATSVALIPEMLKLACTVLIVADTAVEHADEEEEAWGDVLPDAHALQVDFDVYEVPPVEYVLEGQGN